MVHSGNPVLWQVKGTDKAEEVNRSLIVKGFDCHNLDFILQKMLVIKGF